MTYTPSGPTLCELDDVKRELQLSSGDNKDDDRILRAIDAATRQIQQTAGRRFIQDDVASLRWFVPETPWLCEVDDFMTTEGLIIQTYPSGLGQAPVAWSASDYQLEPLNGLIEQQPWPYENIRAIGARPFPRSANFTSAGAQALVAVTARWGWTTVPADVLEASIIQSVTIFKATDAPFGATPIPETGILRLRVGLHPTAALLLSNYTRRALVG